VTWLNDRLDALRGPMRPQDFTARTLAALTTNPGCARRAVLDAAGVDKSALAGRTGFAPPAEETHSRLALARGTEFESGVLAEGGAELIALLRDVLGLSMPEVAYAALDAVGEDTGRAVRFAHTRRSLLATASGQGEPGTLFQHPMLRLDVAGAPAYLEPDVVAFQAGGRFHVIEIKSFPVIDDQGDPARVAAAVTQAAVYQLALREMLAEAGYAPDLVADEIILVTPRDFSLRPTASLVDARTKARALHRQLARLRGIEDLLAALPEGVSFDLDADADGRPRRPAEELRAALDHVPARYRPSCLAACELAHLCREEAQCAGSLEFFGPEVGDQLGGVPQVRLALELATGTRHPEPGQEETAEALRHAQGLWEGLRP
jgi:hypothetical protein